MTTDTSSALHWGLAGTLLITIIFYLVQVLGMQSWTAPFGFLGENWFLVFPLILGFGTQAGLFRAIHLKSRHGGGGAMAASGTVSTGAMFACCMHNLVFLFPILGATGLATFFATYQTYVFLLSTLFVLLGIAYMWKKYTSLHSCCKTN